MNCSRKRVMIFAVLAAMYILVYFYRVSLAVIAADVAKELSLSPGQLGYLSGILFYVYAAAQIPLGPLIDRIGGKMVIFASGLITAVGAAFFGAGHIFIYAFTGRVLIGLGTASVLMATFSIFSRWYSKQEFGKVSGFMVAIGNFGNLAATAPFAWLVSMTGWRNAYLGTAVVQVAAAILVVLFVKNAPDNFAAETDDNETGNRYGMLAAWKKIFGNRDFLLLGMLSFFWYGNYLALQGLWGGPYLMQIRSLERSQAGTLLMFTSIGFIIGSLFIDTLARRYFRSYKKTLMSGQIILLCLVSIFLGPADQLATWLFYPLFFMIGLAVSSGVMIYPIVRGMFPVNIVGTALTSLNFFVLMGAALTQHVMGIIISTFKHGGNAIPAPAFHAAFMFPVTGLLITLVIFTAAKDRGI